MKILFGLSSFFPENTAGTETYVLHLAKELQKLNVEVAVTFPQAGIKSEKYIYENINVYPFYVPLKLSAKEMNGLANTSGIKDFANILDRIKPDIFHLHSFTRSMHDEHIKTAENKGIKTVFTAHLGGTFCVNGDIRLYQKKQCNAKVNKQRCLACFIKKNKNTSIAVSNLIAFTINIVLNTPLKNKFPTFNIVANKHKQLKTLNKFADKNIAIAQWINKAFTINGIKNVYTVEQGISTKFSENYNHTLDNNKIELIFVGRMHPDKGIHILLNALEEYKNNFNLTVVTIPFADETEYYDKIKNKYYSLGYNNWTENASQAQVAEIMNNKDILVLPSIANEAAPLVILEAFAKKIPVIGSSYVAIAEMIEHNKNGLIFKNGNVNSLKEQLRRLKEEPNLIEKFSKNIERPRTYGDVSNEMLKIYNGLFC